MRLTVVSITALLLISGCAFHQTPYVMYEGTKPLNETAVFASASENTSKHVEARITHVNGNATSCAQAGCPYWVRVLPGTNTFKIKYQTDYKLLITAITHNYAYLDVTVKDMKPTHVYVARYREGGGAVGVSVEDLGERPKYGLTLGLEGVNKNYYPVSFD